MKSPFHYRRFLFQIQSNRVYSIFVLNVDETMEYTSSGNKPEEFSIPSLYQGSISYSIHPQTIQQRENEAGVPPEMNPVTIFILNSFE